MKRQNNRIELTERERTMLEGIKNKHTTPRNEAKWAHIILLADEGVAYVEIARRFMILSFTSPGLIISSRLELN